MLRYFHEIVFVVVGISVIILNFTFFTDVLPLFSTGLNILGSLIAVIPPVWLLYSKFRIKREVEDQFMIFILDLTESINSGMTLPLALKHVSRRDYMALSPYVNSVASQVDWGIPFQKALEIFAKKTDSTAIKRAVQTIVQTYKIGGRLSETLNAIGESLMTIDKIKKERSASVHSQIVTSYMIYFVFILILVILQVFLVPALLPQKLPGLGGTQTSKGLPELYTQSFINFIIIQGFFAGLVTGKMAEGSIIAGLKHSILLIIVGYTIFTFSTQLEIKII